MIVRVYLIDRDGTASTEPGRPNLRLNGMTRRNWVTVAAAFVTAAGFTLVSAAPAAASCAVPASPSPYAFTGTVVETRDDGREALVRTESGREVTVLGSAEPGSITSVDRQFAVGARYEFHPLNDSSPYRDNACTATKRLSGPEYTADTEDGFLSSLPGWLPVDDDAGPGPVVLALLVPAVLLVTAAGLVVARMRRARSRLS